MDKHLELQVDTTAMRRLGVAFNAIDAAVSKGRPEQHAQFIWFVLECLDASECECSSIIGDQIGLFRPNMHVATWVARHDDLLQDAAGCRQFVVHERVLARLLGPEEEEAPPLGSIGLVSAALRFLEGLLSGWVSGGVVGDAEGGKPGRAASEASGTAPWGWRNVGGSEQTNEPKSFSY